jgi:DNA-binding GntR family transcriptional regulator
MMMESQPRHRTLRSWVYESLSERIVTGQLVPGSALVETQLATEMGVSRSPIREAIRQLEHDGLVIALPNAATTVAPIVEADIEQYFEMRDLLESCLVAHAAELRTEDELRDCFALLEMMSGIAHAKDIPHYAEADTRFHSLLWKMGKRPRISETLVPLANHVRRYLTFASNWLHSESKETLLASHGEHLVILRAIELQDVDTATAAIRDHMRSSRVRIMQGLWNAQEGRIAKESMQSS